MQYVVKRGYTYVNPKTDERIQAGQLVSGEIDQTQKWKLQTGELVPLPHEIPKVQVKKPTFDEATAALVKKRDEITKARREARTAEQKAEVATSEAIAAKIMSDAVKTKKSIEPEDYKCDEMDEGEET